MKQFTSVKRRHFFQYADTACTVVGLMLSLQISLDASKTVLMWNGILMLAALAASRVFEALFKKGQISKAAFAKELCFAGAYLLCALLFAVLRDTQLRLQISIAVFFGVVIVNRVFALNAQPKTLRKMIVNGALILLVVVFLGFLFLDDEAGMFLFLFFSFPITVKALFHIIGISFSRINPEALRKIIRKTYVTQILFGQLLLIVSCAAYFKAMEPGFETYLDALWYCFAVVTTIGFGDYTVAMPFSRFLTVVLGIYGIIVVALITSVIVNFYGEVKDEKEDDEESDH